MSILYKEQKWYQTQEIIKATPPADTVVPDYTCMQLAVLSPADFNGANAFLGDIFSSLSLCLRKRLVALAEASTFFQKRLQRTRLLCPE